MVPLASLGAFTVAAVLLILMPGPSILFVIGRALGRQRLQQLLADSYCSSDVRGALRGGRLHLRGN